MAMELGGRASKLGDTYERLWAVRYALAIIEGRYQSLRWEPVGDDENGIDLWVTGVDGNRIGHQFKRENRSKEYWSVTDLRAEGVLESAKLQLEREPTAEYVFVSSCPVRHLRDLAERSRREDSPANFVESHAKAEKERYAAFTTLLSAWGLNAQQGADIDSAFRLLRRMTFEVVDRTKQVRGQVEHLAALQLEGDPATIVASLGDLLDNHLGHEFHADELRGYLRSQGFRFRRLAGDPRLPEAVEQLQGRFDRAISTRLIAGTSIPRPEAADVIARILADLPPRLVFVHGGAGAGKSVVLHQVFAALAAQQWPVLPLQLHAYRPEGHPNAFGAACGLPGSPAICLRALAGQRRAVLILDQLDSLRLTSLHSQGHWEAFLRVVEDALADPGTIVVAACRSFDLENDPNIASWKRERAAQGGVIEIRVDELPDEDVERIIRPSGVNFADLPGRQRILLRHPSNLAIWMTLTGAGERPLAFDNATGLMRQFIALRRREIVRDYGVAETEVRDALTHLVAYLDREGRLDAPAAVLAGRQTVINALCSVGLLSDDRGSLTFVHQSYFDHLVAERVLADAVRGGRNVLEWIKSNQSLFRRDQLRQLLTMLRESDPPQYGSLIRSILLSEDVRFHLKHLVLGLLRQAEPVLEDEAAVVSELSRERGWRDHVRGVIWNRPPWFDALQSCGTLSSWLTAEDDTQVREALRFLRSVAEARGLQVDELLAPYWGAGEPWSSRLTELLSFNPADDSAGIAALRLQKVRTGEVLFDGLFGKELAKRSPEMLIRLTAGSLEVWLRQLREHMRAPNTTRLPDWHLRDARFDQEARDAFANLGPMVWELLSEPLRTITRLRRAADKAVRTLEDCTNIRWDLRHALETAQSFVEGLLLTAVEGMARQKPTELMSLLDSLIPRDARGLEYAITRGLAAGDILLADTAVHWLLESRSRFRLGDGHKELYWEPAILLIRRFAEHCSDPPFAQLEDSILVYHEDWERRSIQVQLEYLRKGELIPNDWGRAQNVLLAALPPHRMSLRAKLAANTWRAKFGDPASERPTNALGSGGWVTSTIPSDRLIRVSDREWLSIISRTWPAHGAGRWKQLGPDTVGEASLRTFIEAFGRATKSNPKRFAALGLRMPRESDPGYFAALIRELTNTSAPQNTPGWEPSSIAAIDAVINHVGDCDSKEYVQAVCFAVGQRHDEPWSCETVDRIISYVSHPDPRPGEFTVHRGTGRENEMKPDVGSTALNCVRGAVAGAITALLWSRPDAYNKLLPAIERLLSDPHPSIRYEALGACLPVWNRDKMLAVQLAVAACGHEDDRVLGSHWLNKVIRIARARHLPELSPVIERMAKSAEDSVAEWGAAWATACWLDDGRFAELVESCRSGSASQKKGVATAVLQYFAQGQSVDRAAVILRHLFNDGDEGVRTHAARVFHRDEALSVPQCPALALDFVHSAAYRDHPDTLLHPLSKYAGDITSYIHVVFGAVEVMVAELAADTRDLRHRHAFAGDELSVLLLRIYDTAYGSRNRKLQDECLDRWDLLLKNQVGMTDRHLRLLDD